MSKKLNPIFNALTIAGSDSGGGAGIQADLKTFSALGVYGASVITALTAQNTREVRGVFPVTPEFIQLQLATVFDDIHVSAVKTGMLGDSAVVAAVAGFLKTQKAQLVVDPIALVSYIPFGSAVPHNNQRNCEGTFDYVMVERCKMFLEKDMNDARGMD